MGIGGGGEGRQKGRRKFKQEVGASSGSEVRGCCLFLVAPLPVDVGIGWWRGGRGQKGGGGEGRS